MNSVTWSAQAGAKWPSVNDAMERSLSLSGRLYEIISKAISNSTDSIIQWRRAQGKPLKKTIK